MKSSLSLPSLFSQSKLFSSELQLESARSQFKVRLSLDNKNQTEERKPARSLIHFHQNVDGFMSFKTINSSKTEDILQSLKGMRSSTTNLGKAVKAEILFNKKQYAKITDYCSYKKKNETEQAINRLAKLEPLPMKKEVKKTEKYHKKTKTTVGIKTSLNYEIYQQNRLNWKPFIDFDAMSVTAGTKTYFIGGRKLVPLSYYDRNEDKWMQQDLIDGLKTFGESEGTIVSENEVVFFGGSKFFVMGESQVTNSLTYVNLKNKTARVQLFEEQKVPSRCFHGQCKYGDFLIISGGISKQNKVYNNFMAYHLIKKYWFELTIAKTEQKLLDGFAKHKMMTVMHQRRKYNIYEDEPITVSDAQREQISQEGIYVFGGEDSNVELSNKLYILKLGKPSIEIYEPKLTGTPPTARKNFAWTRVRQFLFIHGGRNDEMRPWVLGNLCVLNLKTMSWLSVKGDKPALRHSHSLVASGNEIVVLGGKNVEGLCKEVYPIRFQEVIQYV